MKKILLLAWILTITSCVETVQNRGTAVVATQSSQQRNVSSKSTQSYNFGDYHALLIYVEDYTHLDPLKTPKSDIEAMEKLLKSRYGFKDITIIRNPKSRGELVDALDELNEKIAEDDNLLIYYAGHGNSQGYWQLKEALPNRRAGWVFIKEVINDTLKNMRAKHILVISDSCYSGMLTRDSNAMVQGKRDFRYYSKLNEKKSRTVLTSGGLEPVLDKDPTDKNHSLFANGLIKTLQKNQKPIFVLEEKYPNIKQYVNLGSASEQTPVYRGITSTGHEIGGDFIFVDSAATSIRVSPKREPNVVRPIVKEEIISPSIDEVKEGNKYRKSGDIQKAKEYYRKACDLHNKIGCAWLGWIYGKKEHNDKQAIIFLTKACAYGHQKSCKMIGE